MIYLSDVPVGGHTIFIQAGKDPRGLSFTPLKYNRDVWFNPVFNRNNWLNLHRPISLLLNYVKNTTNYI
jgi:hypothetical protein